MLKIEEGKYYKTRDGRKVGPIDRLSRDKTAWCGSNAWWVDSGKQNKSHEGPMDLIAEWTEGPVVTETVTKTRIVPGVYGCIQVGEPTNADVCVSFVGKIYYSADDLDAAAAVLSALAKGLRDAT